MQLHTPLRYKAWADRRTLQAVAGIDRQAHGARFDFARQQLNHLVRVEELFRARLTGGAEPHASTNTPALPELAELVARLEASNQWLQDYVQRASAAQLAETVRFTFVDGQKGALSREEMVFHLVNHASYHRGAIGHALDLAQAARPADTYTVFVHAAEPARREGGPLSHYAIKAPLRVPVPAVLTLDAQKTMYGGKRIAAGDTVYLFASENEGGTGLVAKGVVTAATALPRDPSAARQTPRVRVVVRRTELARRPLGRAELKPFRHWDDGQPQTELNFKFYRQATNKVVGLSAPAAAFLEQCFGAGPPPAAPRDQSIPVLPSRSLARTVDFYARLGFRGELLAAGTYAILTRGDLELHFFPHPRLRPAACHAGAYMRVADVDGLHAALDPAGLPGRGIPRLEPVEDKPWRMREFALIDEDGNRVRFGRPAQGPAP